MSQINPRHQHHFASFLVSGSVSWMYYADRLMEFPTGILGVALGTILLPAWPNITATTQRRIFTPARLGLRLSFLLSLPAAGRAGGTVGPLIATLFQYGKFGIHDCR